MREQNNWIEPAVKAIIGVCAVLAVVALIIGSIVGYHFIAKFW